MVATDRGLAQSTLRLGSGSRSTKNPLTVILFAFLGLGTWLFVSALYSEAALFVPKHCTNDSLAQGCMPFDGVPEKYEIYAVIDVAVQASNIVPLIYVALFSKFGRGNRPPTIEIAVVFSAAIAASFLLGAFWDDTAEVFGGEYSVVIIVATFIGGIVGSMSMVTVWPFVSYFGQAYTSVLSMGIGLCGLVASALAFSQGVGQCVKFQEVGPYYSIQTFFSIVGSIIILSLVSLFLIVLQNRRSARKWLGQDQEAPKSLLLPRKNDIDDDSSLENASGDVSLAIIESEGESSAMALESENRRTKDVSEKHIPTYKSALIYAFVVIFGTCFFQYASIGLTSYLFDQSAENYHCFLFLHTVTFNVGSIIGRIITIRFKLFRLLPILFAQGIIFVYLYTFAFLHHVDIIAPGWLTIILNILFSIFHGYLFTMVFLRLRRDVSSKNLAKASRYCGLVNQMGSLIGSVITFVLVHYHVVH